MAQKAVIEKGLSIRLACAAFCISETCYRYQAKLSDANAEVADWLIRLTNNQRNWGFGLCYLYLRNVKGFRWNHKRVYRIYRELELNLRIKPRKHLVREKPEPLMVPEAVNQCWSMDFMHDQLSDGRGFRLLNVIDDSYSVCTTGLNTSAVRWPLGLPKNLLIWFLFSRETPSKTLISSATTEQCDTIGWPIICSNPSKRFRISPHAGSGHIIMNGRTWHSEE